MPTTWLVIRHPWLEHVLITVTIIASLLWHSERLCIRISTVQQLVLMSIAQVKRVVYCTLI